MAGPQFRRHIVVDNLNKTIYIEVQTDLNYYPKTHEYNAIVNGLYHRYLPADLLKQLTDAVNNGYQVKPVLCMGLFDNDYYVLQLQDFGLKKQSTDSKLILS